VDGAVGPEVGGLGREGGGALPGPGRGAAPGGEAAPGLRVLAFGEEVEGLAVVDVAVDVAVEAVAFEAGAGGPGEFEFLAEAPSSEGVVGVADAVDVVVEGGSALSWRDGKRVV
jgi:hypothetical protein